MTESNDNTPAVQAFAVTLEYHETHYIVVPVEARNVDEAIALALQTEAWESARPYDAVGDTFVGHVGRHDSMAAAERAGCREGEALTVPFEYQEDCEQLADVKVVAGVLLAALQDLLNSRPMSGDRARAALAQAAALGIVPAKSEA